MRLLITGANGFIGHYFVNHYKDIYNISTFSFSNDDFATLDLSNIEVVIHLSALVHQMDEVSKEQYEKINVGQTLDLANKARKNSVKHFIFMSSIKVYGEENELIYTINSKCNPQDDYGKSKLKAELELQKLMTNDFIVSIVRTPIVYGFGVKANMKNLINSVDKISVLPFAQIHNKRSIVYVGNLCYLLNEVIKQQVAGIFLASDDNAISTTKLVQLIATSLNKKIYLIKIPLFPQLLKVIKPSFYQRLYGSLEVDNTDTKKTLNLKNPYTIEEGVRLMLENTNEKDS